MNHSSFALPASGAFSFAHATVIHFPGVIASLGHGALALRARAHPHAIPYERPTRQLLSLVGACAVNYMPTVFAQCEENERACVEDRCLAFRFDPRDIQYPMFANWVQENISFFFPHGVSKIHVTENDFQHWLSRYPLFMRKRYLRALEQLQVEIIDYSRVNRISLFMKVEKQNYSSIMGLVKKVPRFIAGGSDEIAVLTGPWYWKWSKYLASVWDGDAVPIQYAPGLTAEGIGKFMEHNGHGHPSYHYLNLDIEKMDHSVKGAVYGLPLLFQRLAGAPESVVRCMIQDHKKRGAGRYVASIAWEEDQASGRFNTTTDQTVRAVVATIYGLCLSSGERSARALWEKTRFRHIGGGDDGCTEIPATFPVFAAERLFWDTGLTFTVDRVTHSYEAEFYSGRFWPTDSGIVYAGFPARVITRSGFYADTPESLLHATHYQTVCQQMQSHSFVPPVYSYLMVQRNLLRDDKRIHRRVRPETRPVHTEKVHGVCLETWAMLHYLYGWSEDDQEVWDTALSKAERLPFFFQHPLLDKLVARDLGLPSLAGSWAVSIDHLVRWFKEQYQLDLEDFIGPALGFLRWLLNLEASQMYFHSDTPLGETLTIIMLNVIAEEIVKRVSLGGEVGCWLLVLSEGIGKCSQGAGGVIGAVVGFFFHFWTARMPFWRGVAVHFAWNTAVFAICYLIAGDTGTDQYRAKIDNAKRAFVDAMAKSKSGPPPVSPAGGCLLLGPESSSLPTTPPLPPSYAVAVSA